MRGPGNRVTGADLDHLLQLLRLGVGQPAQHIPREQSAFTVVAGVAGGVVPAAGGEVLSELLLELDLLVLVHVSGCLPHVDLPGDRGGDQRRAALTRELDEPFSLRDQGVGLGRLLIEVGDDPALLLESGEPDRS